MGTVTSLAVEMALGLWEMYEIYELQAPVTAAVVYTFVKAYQRPGKMKPYFQVDVTVSDETSRI